MQKPNDSEAGETENAEALTQARDAAKDKVDTPGPSDKPTPNQQIIDEGLNKVPFGKPLKEFFFSEGKAARQGWLVFLVVAGLTLAVTHHFETKSHETAMSATNSYFGNRLAALNQQVSDTEKAKEEIKQERDKAQLMLAPFQALAIKVYTNAPLEERLELLADTIISLTNQILNPKPNLSLIVNGLTLTNMVVPIGTKVAPNIQIHLNTNREIPIVVRNHSVATAEHLTLEFIADIDPTNVVMNVGWARGLRQANGWNSWKFLADATAGSTTDWHVGTLRISPHFRNAYFLAKLRTHADRSETKEYWVAFVLPN